MGVEFQQGIMAAITVVAVGIPFLLWCHHVDESKKRKPLRKRRSK